MRQILTVSEISKYLKSVLSRDFILSDVRVKGEISNYKNHYSGHMYFTLKDKSSLIRCVMFKSSNQYLNFRPENGMSVVAYGYISIYERDGQYQLYVQELEPEGIGSLHKAFEQLKVKLGEKGLFDEAHKKKLPLIPSAICVVTSSTGSVIRDIINVLARRFPNVKLRLYPVAVQGERAAHQISNAINDINEHGLGDIIIVARGGGSLEELWAFNEEIVAISIYDSKIPVISAVGHETDFTIADFVADVRAPTPSAAAELTVPEKLQLAGRINGIDKRLKSSLVRVVTLKKEQLKRLSGSMVFRQPYNKVYQARMGLDLLMKTLKKEAKGIIEKNKNDFAILVNSLNSTNPLNILSRGYGIVKHPKSKDVIKSVSQISEGDAVSVSVSDGEMSCRIEEIKEDKDVFKNRL